MTKLECAFLCSLLLSAFGFGTPSQEQGQPPVQGQQEAPSEAPLPPPKPPRVVGQAQTQEEWEAWQLVTGAAGTDQQAELAKQFLENYPESGLTPNAHHILARHYYGQSDFPHFVEHAEKSLAEIPGSADILAQLAFYYSEQKQPQKAIDRATRALQATSTLQKPLNLGTLEWVRQIYKLKSDANYALGRAQLDLLGSSKESRQAHLKKAVEYLSEALRDDPRHDYACFRLGYAYRNLNDVKGALTSFGRAVVIGGVASAPAEDQINQILAIVKKGNPDSSWAKKSSRDIVDEAAQQLVSDEARLQDQISQEAAEIESREQLQKMQLTPPTQGGGEAPPPFQR